MKVTNAVITPEKESGSLKKLSSRCEKCARKIGWINLIASAAITILRIVVGILSGSAALLTSSFYSFTNAGAALIIIIARKISDMPVDKEHPFGHDKVEFIAVFFLSVLFIIGLIFLTVTTMNSFISGTDTPPHWIAILVAVASIIIGRILYAHTICVGKNLNSPAICAQAEHIHSDTTGNIVVLVGVIGARLGFYFMDPLAAMVEVVHLILLIRQMFFFSVSGLMDQTIDQNKLKEIERYARSVPGIHHINRARARQVGQLIWVDLNVELAGELNIAEGNKIIENVKKTITSHVSHIGNITVSFAPADRMEYAS
ncbi:MAG: cation diffusion facilitator family transporter [bacterium]